MSKRNRYLTGFLMLLVGVLLGGVFVLFQQGAFLSDHSPVHFTEVKKSEKPFFSDEELKKIDSRFLFKQVAHHVIPTVVYISSIVTLDDDEHPFGGDDHSFWDRFRSRHARTIGSGVIVSRDGYIVTNNHVIDGAAENDISVILNNKRVYDARIVGTDPTTDLAILKVDGRDLPAITFGNSDRVDVGAWVLAIGNPFRLRSTVTAGIVSALSRQVDISGETKSRLNINSFIQTDAAINKGNSGGALVNTSGELVGINTAIASQDGNYQGYGFAVPSNLVRKVMGDLIQFGSVHRAMLGVSILGVDYERAENAGLDAVKGVEITNLAKDGEAAKQGLKQYDIILAVNGEPVNESNELQEKIAVHQPQDTVHLSIWRDHQALEKTIRLGRAHAISQSLQDMGRNINREKEKQKENPHQMKSGSFSLGFKVIMLTTAHDKRGHDLIIARVYPSSEAARQEMETGAIIKEVNDQPVGSISQLKMMISSVPDEETLSIKTKNAEGETKTYHFH